MTKLQRIVKPKTQRGRRALEKKAPKLIENIKTAIFIRGAKTSDKVLKCMKDLAALKRPHGVFFGKKNELQPFEETVQLERFAEKQDASLFMFASHNKKRPHNLVIGRTFDSHVLDMIELGVNAYKGLQDFKVPKIATGTKPLLLFVGEAFEQDDVHQRLKNLLLDFFSGPVVPAIRLAGLEHVLLFSAVEGKIQFRSFKVLMKKSGTRVPRIELDEIGPSMDFLLRRSKLASDDLYKRSRKQPVQLKKRKIKNIRKDNLGRQLGRVHMHKQDLNRLQTRKMKGLKKTNKKKEKGDSNRSRTNATKRISEGGSQESRPLKKRRVSNTVNTDDN